MRPFHPPRLLRAGLVTLALLSAAACPGNCYHFENGCSRARASVCACGSSDCEAGEPAALLDMLERCESRDFTDEEYDQAYCLANLYESHATYCAMRDALAAQGPEACEVPCHENTACDLYEACKAFQREHCDLPPDGGSP